MNRPRNNLKPILGLLFIAFLLYLSFFSPARELFTQQGLGGVREWIRQQGIWAPAIYILIYVGATVLCLPGSILSLTAGPLFGTFLGFFYVVVASNVGANLSFLLARYLGAEFVAGMLGDRWKKLRAGEGIFWVFVLRLIPAVPFNVLNYAAGLTSLSFRDHVVGTFLGMLPGTLVYVALGSALGELSLRDGEVWRKPEVWGALGLAIVFLFLLFLTKMRARGRK